MVNSLGISYPVKIELPSKLIFSLGKIDYYNKSKRKLNQVTIELSFEKDNKTHHFIVDAQSFGADV